MSNDTGQGPRFAPQVGLCATCLHARAVENRRGSRFVMCGRAATNPAYDRYPRLPVRECPGYQRSEAGTSG